MWTVAPPRPLTDGVWAGWRRLLAFILLAWMAAAIPAADFVVATYNLERYGLPAPESRPGGSREPLHRAIAGLGADLLVAQEVGGQSDLEELRGHLRRLGLEYPWVSLVPGPGGGIHIAFLSRHPFELEDHRNRLEFVARGRRQVVARGFGLVRVRPPGGDVVVIGAHLKSRREVSGADEEALRQGEAELLRALIDESLRRFPESGLLVAGDLNDIPSSRAARRVVGSGPGRLEDLRPVEKGEPGEAGGRRSAWTYYWEKEETYSRVDYILVNSVLRKWVEPSGTHIPTLPDWGLASDHRPLRAAFRFPPR